MKKAVLIIAICTLLFAVIPPFFLGFSLWQLHSAMKVSAGMGAKLACSAKFISGFDEAKILDDLASYSPANKLLDLYYDIEQKRVDASFLNIETSSAYYRDGLGCSLFIDSRNGDNTKLDQAFDPSLVNRIQPNDHWPIGEIVETIDRELQQKLDQILSTDNEKGYDTRALAVVKNGQLIAESYAPGISYNTPLLGWSMGKSVTAIMLGRMQQLRMVDLTQNDLFDEWRNDDRKNISLLHLLTMTSGLNFDEFYQPGSDVTKMLFYSYSASDVAIKKSLKNIPGEHYSYSSGTTNLLQRWMQEQLGGSPIDSVNFLYNEIFEPLGMYHTIFEPDPSGVFVGSSYIYGSARDWARLGMLMAEQGKVNEQTILDEEWVKQASQPNNSENYHNYGYQFWLNQGEKHRWPKLPKDAFLMSGNRKQYVMIFPSERIVIVRLGWTKSHYPMEDNFSSILDKISIH